MIISGNRSWNGDHKNIVDIREASAPEYYMQFYGGGLHVKTERTERTEETKETENTENRKIQKSQLYSGEGQYAGPAWYCDFGDCDYLVNDKLYETAAD